MNNDGEDVKQKIDIGGIKLQYEFFGKEDEYVTMVFDSGYGWDLTNWNSIRSEVSQFAKMFIYNRAGIGESGKDDRPLHSKQNIENLRTLLQRAGVKPPYVLVGHSFGGANVRLFASEYPEEVAGVILLDSVHENQNKFMAPLFSDIVKEKYYGQFSIEASLGEFEASLEQIRASKSLGDVPLLVVTGGTQPHHTSETWSYWTKFQKELATLSTNSRHIIVNDAGHAIHVDCTEAVIRALKEMYKSIQT